MDTLRIRRYGTEDFDQLVAFMVDLQQYFFEIDSLQEQISFTTKNDAERYIQQALKDVAGMDGAVYIAEHHEKVAGFIQGVIVKHSNDIMHGLTHKKSVEGWVGLLFTGPEFRNKGVGKQLLEEMRVYFTKKNCTSMRLKVSSDNKLAIRVYEKYGFKPRDLEMAVKI